VYIPATAEGVKVYVELVASGVPVPVEFENHSTTHPAGAVAVKVVEAALLHAVTLPLEIGAEGRALTVIVAGCVDAHPVVGFVAATV
jgi:hypothetical protein